MIRQINIDCQKSLSDFRCWKEGISETHEKETYNALIDTLSEAELPAEHQLGECLFARTMIRFLIELLVRLIWFGQSNPHFILNWLVMRCKLRPDFAADAQQTAWSKM